LKVNSNPELDKMDNIIVNEKNSTKSVSPAKAYAEEIVMSEPTEYQ
jgi:hypothetical protein